MVLWPNWLKTSQNTAIDYRTLRFRNYLILSMKMTPKRKKVSLNERTCDLTCRSYFEHFISVIAQMSFKFSIIGP